MKMQIHFNRHKTISFLLRFGIVIAVILAFSFLGLPPLVKHFATKALGEKFHRTVVIGELSINPLNLSVRINDFSMQGQDDKTPFFSVHELYANLESASILEGAPVLHEIRIKSPYLRIVRHVDNSYNIDDILKELLKPSESPTKYSINNIQLEGGKVEFNDQPKHAQHTFSEIQFTLPFLSNLPYQADIYVKPDFSAKVNGSPLHLTGQLKPFSNNRESTVSVSISKLDVAHYFEYIPLQNSFGMSSGQLDASLTISFAQPPKQSPSIALSGKAELKGAVITEGKDIPLARFSSLAVDLQSADLAHKKIHLKSISLQQPEFHLSLSKTHRLAASAKEIKLTGGMLEYAKSIVLSQPALEISGLRLQRDQEKEGFLEIAKFGLKETNLDMNKRSIELGELTSSDGNFALKRDKNGVIDLIDFFNSGSVKAAENKPGETENPFQFAVKKLSLAGYNVTFSDAIADEPVNLAADAIKIDAENFSNQSNSLSKLALAMNLNKTGTLSSTGELGINPLSMRFVLDLKGVKLRPFQPYFTEMLNIAITDGALSAKGELKMAAEAKGTPKIKFNGDASLDRLATIDKLNKDDFLKWNRLRFNNMSVATEPLRVDIAEVSLANFYSRLIIHSNGSLNLQQILKENTAAAQKNPTPTGANTPSSIKPATQPKEKQRITIKKLTLRDGKVDFSDQFIKPNYSAHLTGLGGEVKGLSSDIRSLAEVALKGRVDNQGRLDITGKINPLSGNLYLDLLANLTDFELSPLTPYSSKYAGYGIQKGKLSFDVKYKIENRKLTAENHLFLNQLTFGDKVDSPDATKLPVMLAVALLKDRNGNIDISLPISGSLDDPQFSMGGIIIKVIVNLVVKAVTSPFALIGSLFGGGDELSYLEFEYGKSTIPANAETKLNNLAKALQDRPGLKIDISAQVDPELDRDGIKHVLLERKVKTQKFNELQNKGSDITDIEQIKIDPAEYVKYLTKAYKQEKIPNKPRNIVGIAKDLPVAEMEKLMLANIQVNEDDLRDLTNHRAMEAKEYLINVGKIEPERVFIVAQKAAKPEQEKATDKGKLSRVSFSLGAR